VTPADQLEGVSKHKRMKMDKLPSDLISEIDLLLGVKGKPYSRLVDGVAEQTKCYQWTEAESSIEIVSSLSPELAQVMADAQEKMLKSPSSFSDPMPRIRKHIAKKAPHLAKEYDEFVARLELAERRLLYPTGTEPPSIPEEIREIAERIADEASSLAHGNLFDLDVYLERSQELWQQQPVDVQAAQKRFQQAMDDYRNSFLEAENLKGDRLASVRSRLKGRPYTAYGDVVVAPTDDQYDILRVEQTNGANYGLQTEDIIDALKSTDQQFGVDILDAGFDFVRFSLATPPSDEELEQFNAGLLQLCPDLEGEENILVESVIQLWWD
jgi:hypothetical protein